MSTFEAYVNLGTVSIAVSAVGAPIRVESKRADVDAPAAILTVLLPFLNDPETEESIIDHFDQATIRSDDRTHQG